MISTSRFYDWPVPEKSVFKMHFLEYTLYVRIHLGGKTICITTDHYF